MSSFARSKICQFDDISFNQDVLGFEFSVDDALVVENFDANNNLGK